MPQKPNMKEIEGILIKELTYAMLRSLTQILSNKDVDTKEAVEGTIKTLLGMNRYAFLHQIAEVIVASKLPSYYILNSDFIEDMDERLDASAYASYIINRLQTEEEIKDVFSDKFRGEGQA